MVIQRKKKETNEPVIKKTNNRLFIPSGSTLLNLACSETIRGAYALGKVVTMPGASSTGKTLMQLTMFAEMNKISEFKDYDLYYDDVEESLEFDLTKFNLQDRLLFPIPDKDPPHSDTIEDFKSNMLLIAKKKRPFVYILDSLDALTSTVELEREYKNALKIAKSDEHVKELKNSYKTEKAKTIGEILRMTKQILKELNSVLIIVQQKRQKIGVVFGDKSTTSGGEAPFFYSSYQIWLKHRSEIKEKGILIGNKVIAKVSKNKFTGKRREVEFEIYDEFGIDDIGSCIDYLVLTEHWKKASKGVITAKEFNVEKTKKALITEIEKNDYEERLKRIVGRKWLEIENSVKLNRKAKY